MILKVTEIVEYKRQSTKGGVVLEYHVSVTVRGAVYEKFVEWLQSEHIDEVLQSEGFLEAELLLNKKGIALESSSKQLKIIYKVRSEFELNKYLKERALILRNKGMDRFPGEYTAEREIWSSVEQYVASK